MPLSEDEQRILHEIEQQLYETDPGLAREVGSTTVYTHAFRNLKWATFAFILGAGLLLMALSVHYVLAFGAFLVMFASAMFFERNARRLGRVGLEQMTQNMRGAGVRDYFGSAGSKMRDRFRSGEEPDNSHD